MSTKIIDIEGIGNVYAEKLHTIGIHTVEKLLEEGASKQGRVKLAESSGISETHILRWVNMADLFRIKGVGEEYSDLLDASGVDTVKELRHRVPANLHAKMVEVNEQKKLVRSLPALSQVEHWIEHAKTLDPIVTY